MSGNDKPKTSRGCTLIILLLVFVCTFFFVREHNESESSKVAEADRPPELAVSATEIMDDYKNNEVRADEKYKDKRVQITGKVRKIDKSFGSMVVSIGSINVLLSVLEFSTVDAYFSDREKSDVAALNKGDGITVVCTVRRGSGATVRCEDSKIVK